MGLIKRFQRAAILQPATPSSDLYDLRDWPTITHPAPATAANHVLIGSGSALLRHVADPNDVRIWHRYEGIAPISATLPDGLTAGATIYLFLCANSSCDPALATAFFSISLTGSTNRPAGYDWIKYVASFVLNGAALIPPFGPLLYESERDTVVPPGAILPFAAGTPPVGWIKTNGALIPRAIYANLWAIAQIEIAEGRGGGDWWGNGDGSTTFKIPESRGVVLRGWDDGRGIDLGRVLGSYQADAFQYHAHTVVYSTAAGSQGILQGSLSASGANNASQQQYQGMTAMFGQAAPRVEIETRAKSLAPLFIIKY